MRCSVALFGLLVIKVAYCIGRRPSISLADHVPPCPIVPLSHCPFSRGQDPRTQHLIAESEKLSAVSDFMQARGRKKTPAKKIRRISKQRYFQTSQTLRRPTSPAPPSFQSNEMISKLIAMVAEDPTVKLILDELLSGTGPELQVRNAPCGAVRGPRPRTQSAHPDHTPSPHTQSADIRRPSPQTQSADLVRGSFSDTVHGPRACRPRLGTRFTSLSPAARGVEPKRPFRSA